tara:strand:- start:4086 stop:8237 length:4152 start_codon:yes stop_codon:yes gene_type:complete
MRILDSELTGDANLPFTAAEDGFRIWYVGEDQEFQDPIKASMLTIPFVVQTPQDAAFINSVILTQESQFYVEVLKDGSPFWRGIILTDEMTYEVAPYPYIVELTASDGLGELKEIFEKGGNSNIAGGEFDNITSRIIGALRRMPSYNVWEDTEPILQSCVKWFDVGMPSNTIDPFTHTKFNDKNIVYTIDENTGEEKLISQYEVLNTILRGWNCRIMQVNARFYVLQCSEYEKANLDTFIYSGEYTSGILPTEPGVLGSNVPLDVNYNIGLNWSFDYVKEADAVYQFLSAVRYARVKFDGELAPLFYKRVDVDLTTLQTTNQFTIANGVLGLDVQGSHFVQLEDTITPATQAKINYTLTTSITLKIGTFYWDGSTWTNTISTFDVLTNSSFISEGNTENLTVPFNFITAPIPVQDDLEIKVESTVLVTSVLPSGTNYNVNVITNETTIDIFYDDPTGTGVNINYFETKNDLFSNSTVGIDLGDVIIGDRDISLQLGNYFLWNNNNTKQWRYNSVLAGGSAINQLLVRELVHQRKNPRRKFELDIRGSFEAYQRITFEGRYFIINGGTFTARDESFECTMLELSRVEGNVTDESSTGAGNPGNPTFSIGSSLGGGLNDRMRWAGNFNELLPGAVLQPNDVTLDSGWLAVANKETTDSPAPIVNGDPFVFIGDNFSPSTTTSNSVITSGHTYTFTEDTFVSEILVYPTTVAANWSYRVFIKDLNSGSETILNSLTLVAGQWNSVSVGNNTYSAGTELLIYLETTHNSGSATYYEDFNFWPTNPPPTGISVSPYLEFNGVAQSPEVETAMGVDIQIQDVTFSPDFSILSYSDFFASGGSGVEAVESVNGQTGVVSLALNNLTDVSSSGASDGDIIVYRTASGQFVLEQKPAAGTNPAWGDITGTLSSQTDLQAALDLKVNTGDLSTVATSGSYNDLSNKPTTITAQQAADITANNAKISYTDAAQVATNTSNVSTIQGEQVAQDSAIALNTAKVGITTQQAADITVNNAKVGITTAQASAINANTAKRSYPLADENRLANTSGTNTGDQDISGIATNASNISNLAFDVSANTSDIATNGSNISSNTSAIVTNANNIVTITDRANQTGTQSASTISDFDSASNAVIGGFSTFDDGYEIEESDNNSVLAYNDASDGNIVLNENSGNAVSIGFKCKVIQAGDGLITFQTSGASTIKSLNGAIETSGEGCLVEVVKISTNGWLISICDDAQVNKIKTGFLDYNDTTGSIDLVEDVWTDIPNDGAGSFTNKLYKPDDVGEVLDVSTGYLDFSDITLGSQLLIRNDFTVTPGTNNSLLEVRYVLGQGAGEYALKFWSERLDSGSGIGYQRVTSFPIYMGDNNTKGGVGKLQVKLSTDGSITNAGSYIKIDLR